MQTKIEPNRGPTVSVSAGPAVPYETRRLGPDDWDAMKSFYERMSPEDRYSRFHLATVPWKYLEDSLANRSLTTFGVFEDGKIIAVSSYGPMDDAYDFALAVDKGYRGQGLGSRLFGELLGYAYSQGARKGVATCLRRNCPMMNIMESAQRKGQIGSLHKDPGCHDDWDYTFAILEPRVG